MDVARLNYSHGILDEHAETADARARGRESRRPAGGDPPGSPRAEAAHRGARRRGRRARSGRHRDLRLRHRGRSATARRMSVSWQELADGVEPDAILYLADGSVRLRVRATRAAERRARRRGRDRRRRRLAPGAQHPGPAVGRLPAVPPRDLDLLATASRSASTSSRFPSCARRATSSSSASARGCRSSRRSRSRRPSRTAEAVLRAADCVMVARGDLGIELPIEDVPLVQKRLLKLAGELARPSITATQMLDSMVRSQPAHPRRGRRRRQRDPRRNRRRDALAGDGRRRPPRRRGRDDGGDRRAHRGDGANYLRVERAPRPARRARPGVHGRLQRLRRRARARARRARRADALGPLGAPGLGAPPERADLRALSRTTRRCSAAA